MEGESNLNKFTNLSKGIDRKKYIKRANRYNSRGAQDAAQNTFFQSDILLNSYQKGLIYDLTLTEKNLTLSKSKLTAMSHDHVTIFLFIVFITCNQLQFLL